MVRVIVIAIAVILMLAGGAVGVMKQLEMGPFAPEDTEEQVVEAKEPELPRFLDMDPLVIPVFVGDEVAGTIQIMVKLETMGEENETYLHTIMPRLGDAFLRDLYSFIPRSLQKQGNIELPVIKERLKLVADKVAGEGRVDNVLIQSVSEGGG